ncbi:MAG: hypothetical protein ACP5OA_06015, partial [Candidatus Woesearchaeota archaeon]
FKKNYYYLLHFIAELHDKSRKAWIDTSNRFGLDYTTLVDVTNDIIKVSLDKGIKSRIDTLHIKHSEGGRGIQEYAPTISFLKRFYGTDMSRRSIVEVGAAQNGIMALSYLETLGAETYAIDCAPTIDDRLISDSKVNYIISRWEDIGTRFDDNSIDTIYINYMHPSPQYYGRFDRDRSVEDRDLDTFEKYIASEMHRILKPDGFYIMRKVGYGSHSEYLFHNEENFNNYSMKAFKIEQCGERESVIFITENDEKPSKKNNLSMTKYMKYPINSKRKDIYFGDKLIVFQKRE